VSPVEALAAIQGYVINRVDSAALGNGRIAAVIGAAPSRYSKSPALWNAAFDDLSLHARYLPLDVETSKLKELTAVFRDSECLLGINVTVPHKLAVMEFLDELDPGAARIQAVNTVVRTAAGRLIGYNTDGAGFIASILDPQPGESKSFVASLGGANVLLLGAGGSARAVALHVSERLAGGKLIVGNRTIEHALALVAEVRAAGWDAEAIGEDDLASWAPQTRLIVNGTTKGQGGFVLEPYSALAPAPLPNTEPPREATPRLGAGAPADSADIEANNRASLSLAAIVPPEVGFYDLIYHPEETVFLRHGRETGHRTMNGKAMMVCQAAIAFCSRICRAELQARGLATSETYQRVLAIMHDAW
jgi:shikimate dehydrogenase